MAESYPTVRIVVTGSRFWRDWNQIYNLLDIELSQHGQFLLGVGDCPTGADSAVKDWGEWKLDWPVTQFNAPWSRRKKAAGPIRNHFMIDLFRPRLVLAFLRPESRGTVDCADYAESLGIEVRRFYEGEEDGKAGTRQ